MTQSINNAMKDCSLESQKDNSSLARSTRKEKLNNVINLLKVAVDMLNSLAEDDDPTVELNISAGKKNKVGDKGVNSSTSEVKSEPPKPIIAPSLKIVECEVHKQAMELVRTNDVVCKVNDYIRCWCRLSSIGDFNFITRDFVEANDIPLARGSIRMFYRYPGRKFTANSAITESLLFRFGRCVSWEKFVVIPKCDNVDIILGSTFLVEKDIVFHHHGASFGRSLLPFGFLPRHVVEKKREDEIVHAEIAYGY
ncbi:hypothetical protein SJAG_01525 [Schizosaccharomyces japonicus yFS275]|uniref:Uncharacterized protein n=1 Tax=Schizosaccharomyces japonicus (strain yFS275 / FY16936) TaxID=402676 RepID=B6JY66_SCHJY|nr:hypothetical protein SJAG_01525 [Schizosaccharomyces japonicus yFS275]EEB06484.2 hypothetical protein SJAG_01525 [Schizosaccharomyces japonicus yFS275]